MKDRLLLLLKERNLTNARFAGIMEIQPSNISHILSGRNKPGYDFIIKFIEKFPEVNLTWMLTGDGEMYGEGTREYVRTNNPTLSEPGLFGSSGEYRDAKPSLQPRREESLRQPSEETFPTAAAAARPNPSFQQRPEESLRPATDSTSAIPLTSTPGMPPSKKIEKIVVLYDDNTFKEFLPA